MGLLGFLVGFLVDFLGTDLALLDFLGFAYFLTGAGFFF